jgi:hypothetical protein
MDALKGGVSGEPEGSMKRALIFQAVIAWVVVPFPLALGYWHFQRTGLRRLNSAEP